MNKSLYKKKWKDIHFNGTVFPLSIAFGDKSGVGYVVTSHTSSVSGISSMM